MWLREERERERVDSDDDTMVVQMMVNMVKGLRILVWMPISESYKLQMRWIMKMAVMMK